MKCWYSMGICMLTLRRSCCSRSSEEYRIRRWCYTACASGGGGNLTLAIIVNNFVHTLHELCTNFTCAQHSCFFNFTWTLHELYAVIYMNFTCTLHADFTGTLHELYTQTLHELYMNFTRTSKECFHSFTWTLHELYEIIYMNFTWTLHGRTLHELYMGHVNLIETCSGGGGHRTRDQCVVRVSTKEGST